MIAVAFDRPFVDAIVHGGKREFVSEEITESVVALVNRPRYDQDLAERLLADGYFVQPKQISPPGVYGIARIEKASDEVEGRWSVYRITEVRLCSPPVPAKVKTDQDVIELPEEVVEELRDRYPRMPVCEGNESFDLPFRKAKVLAINMKTTGVKHSDRIIQVGCGLIEQKHLLQSVSCMVNPGDIAITQECTRITGIYPALLNGRPGINFVRNSVSSMISQADCIIAHNAPFHIGFLSSEIEISWPENIPVIDSMTLAKNKKMESSALSFLKKKLELNMPERDGDAFIDAMTSYDVVVGLGMFDDDVRTLATTTLGPVIRAQKTQRKGAR